jgi:hypothetical protein
VGLLASPSYELRAFAIPTGVAFEDPRDVGHVLARQVHSGTSASAKRGEVRGLPSYGVDTADIMRRLADITDQVLRASKPGDIPYQQQSKFELIQSRDGEIVEDTNVFSPICPEWHPRQYGCPVCRCRLGLTKLSKVSPLDRDSQL